MRDRDLRFRRVGGAVYGRCRRLCDDPVVAEQTAGTLLTEIWAVLRDAADEQSALETIYRVTTFRCLTGLYEAGAAPAQRPTVPAPSNAVEMDAALQDPGIVSWLARHLPPTTSVPGWLFHIDRMGVTEVASVLEGDRASVEARLHTFRREAEALLVTTPPRAGLPPSSVCFVSIRGPRSATIHGVVRLA